MFALAADGLAARAALVREEHESVSLGRASQGYREQLNVLLGQKLASGSR